MKYKVIISDFDDTLLRSDFTISKATVEAIKAYRDLGGFFTISTGRMYASIKPQLRACGLDNIDIPIMNCQGALAQSSLTDQVIYEHRIDTEVAVKFLDYTRSIDLYSQVYVDNVLYVNKRTKETDLYTDASQVEAVEVGDLKEWVIKNRFCVHKMLTMDEYNANITHLIDFNKRFFNIGLTFTLSHPTLIEVVSNKAGKGNMVKKIVSKMGFDMKDVVCVGDSQNDISMIKMAGLGVAMGNARDEVKAVANFVTDTHDNDGVAKLIYKVINDEV